MSEDIQRLLNEACIYGPKHRQLIEFLDSRITRLENRASNDRECLADAFAKLSGKAIHASDCATSVAPAECHGVCGFNKPQPRTSGMVAARGHVRTVSAGDFGSELEPPKVCPSCGAKLTSSSLFPNGSPILPGVAPVCYARYECGSGFLKDPDTNWLQFTGVTGSHCSSVNALSVLKVKPSIEGAE